MEKPICIIEINENLRRIKLDEPLTRPLKELNINCLFKERYDEWCNIQDGLEPDADIRKIENKDKIKAYREKNKDKINKKRKAYREKNKDKINKKGKAYYEKNKDKINKKRRLKYKLKQSLKELGEK